MSILWLIRGRDIHVWSVGLQHFTLEWNSPIKGIGRAQNLPASSDGNVYLLPLGRLAPKEKGAEVRCLDPHSKLSNGLAEECERTAKRCWECYPGNTFTRGTHTQREILLTPDCRFLDNQIWGAEQSENHRGWEIKVQWESEWEWGVRTQGAKGLQQYFHLHLGVSLEPGVEQTGDRYGR